MNEEIRIQSITNVIKNYFIRYNIHTGWYSDYLSENPIDFNIKYHPTDYSIKKTTGDLECSYEVVIKIKTDSIMIANSDNWIETHGHDDVPSWVWEDLIEDAENNLSELLPFVCFTIIQD